MNLGVHEAELTEMNTNNEKLQRAYSELLEYKLVLQKVSTWTLILTKKKEKILLA